MKTKSPKVYTVPQVGKVLGVGLTTVYDYINAGLIHAERRAPTPGTRGRLSVSEAEFERLKRNGVDAKGVTAKLAGHSAGGRAAAKKKPATRGAAAAATAAKKPVKRKSVATVAKKQVKRAAAATRKVAKKQKRR